MFLMAIFQIGMLSWALIVLQIRKRFALSILAIIKVTLTCQMVQMLQEALEQVIIGIRMDVSTAAMLLEQCWHLTKVMECWEFSLDKNRTLLKFLGQMEVVDGHGHPVWF